MPHANAIDGVRPVMAWGGEPVLLATYFTTNGSGVETIGTGASHGGRVSVSRPDESGAPETYLVDFGCTWDDTQACVVTHQLSATVNYELTIDPTAGTVELAFSGAIVSNRIDLMLVISCSKAR
jgi:hypothetical protein